MKSLKLNISGMTCHNCVRHVTEALKEVPGVTSVSVDLQAKEARLMVAEGFVEQTAAAAVEEAGYSPGAFSAV
ncbi:MAG: heavy-metal-associated domain-containing protein [Deltaproteobacteria bacterium]|nr:heavy-metal-associated domain-containing protein [Deltaproteobacteria bacterium]